MATKEEASVLASPVQKMDVRLLNEVKCPSCARRVWVVEIETENAVTYQVAAKVYEG